MAALSLPTDAERAWQVYQLSGAGVGIEPALMRISDSPSALAGYLCASAAVGGDDYWLLARGDLNPTALLRQLTLLGVPVAKATLTPVAVAAAEPIGDNLAMLVALLDGEQDARHHGARRRAARRAA